MRSGSCNSRIKQAGVLVNNASACPYPIYRSRFKVEGTVIAAERTCRGDRSIWAGSYHYFLCIHGWASVSIGHFVGDGMGSIPGSAWREFACGCIDNTWTAPVTPVCGCFEYDRSLIFTEGVHRSDGSIGNIHNPDYWPICYRFSGRIGIAVVPVAQFHLEFLSDKFIVCYCDGQAYLIGSCHRSGKFNNGAFEREGPYHAVHQHRRPCHTIISAIYPLYPACSVVWYIFFLRRNAVKESIVFELHGGTIPNTDGIDIGWRIYPSSVGVIIIPDCNDLLLRWWCTDHPVYDQGGNRPVIADIIIGNIGMTCNDTPFAYSIKFCGCYCFRISIIPVNVYLYCSSGIVHAHVTYLPGDYLYGWTELIGIDIIGLGYVITILSIPKSWEEGQNPYDV